MRTDELRVYLRAFEPEDYRTTIEWHRDEETWNMVGSPKYFVSTEYEKKWVNDAIWNRDKIKLGICYKGNDELIGFGSIMDMDWINRSAHCPSMIGSNDYRGKGLATEARMLLLDFAFKERGFKRIWAVILEDNIASIRMCEKCGYKNEGVLRSSIYKNGRFQNQVLMSVLSEEFEILLRQKYLD